MANCSDPNNPCTQQGLPCEACSPCADCIQPEVVVITRLPELPLCDPLTDALKELATQQVACIAKIASITVLGRTVTVNPVSPSTNLEFSKDNVLYQDSPTFTNVPCGEKKYFVRQKNNNACIDTKYASVTEDCDCIPYPTPKPVIPLVTECHEGYVRIKTENGCGVFDWQITNTQCGGGGCNETFSDVTPPVTECVAGKVRYKQMNGCGDIRWRDTSENCNTCVQPSVPSQATTTPATCNSSGQILSNGSFTLGPITSANRYGMTAGGTYSGPNYDAATPIAGNGIISVAGLQGYAYSNSYTLRIFNGSNTCFVDKTVTFAAVECPAQCVFPTYTLSKTDPTCNGQASNNNGILHLSNYANASKFQVCVGSSFTCTPNYATATAISGGGMINALSNIGFAANEQFRDYTVRVYNGSQSCFSDNTLRFSNPCYTGGGCVSPTNSTPTIQQATCSGSQLNNNAAINVSGIGTSDKYGYSLGSSYSGPAYSLALPVSSTQINLIGLAGSANDTIYTIRLFNGSDSCKKDLVVTVPGKICDVPCTTPTYNAKSGEAATCTGNVINSNAQFSITGITNMTRYGTSNGNSYTGPPYSGAFASVASSLNVANLPGSAQVQTKTVRLFNGADNCYLDVVVTIPATSCAPTCTNPTFNISSVQPTQCTGEQSSADGQVIINNITNGSKYQICIAPTFNCVPNFANSPVISGAGPITVANFIGFSAGEVNKTVVVRVYNANETCYTDHSVVIQNPCISCCGMVINNIELTNV